MTEYIDREDAKYAIYDLHTEGKRGVENAKPNTYGAALRDVIEQIDNVPAADVKPIVRGKWVWDKDGMDFGIGAWRCSHCGTRPETFWAVFRKSPITMSGSKFCSYCGADMREGSE